MMNALNIYLVISISLLSVTPSYCFQLSSTKFIQRVIYQTTSSDSSLSTVLANVDEVVDSRPKPKVPASAWRFPPKWPFPPDFTETVPFESLTGTGTKTFSPTIKSALSSHFPSFITTSDSVLELSCLTEPVLKDMEVPMKQLSHLELTALNINTTVISIPFKTAAFDRVVIAGGIEYVTEPCDLFREIWRVLKPAGKCFVVFLDKPVPGSQHLDTETGATLSPLKMWTTMTEEQKIWIAGSYFNYSSKFGWNDIEGYDLLASTGAEGMVFEKAGTTAADIAATLEKEHVFVVQADKVDYDHLAPSSSSSSSGSGIVMEHNVDEAQVYNYLMSSMQGLRNIGSNANPEASYALDCTSLLAHRLTALYKSKAADMTHTGQMKWDMLDDYSRRFVQIFDVLKGVKEVVMPTPVKAMLASYLVEQWRNTGGEREALKQGVGLVPIDAMDSLAAGFWTALASETTALQPRDKIALLGDLIPAMGDRESDRTDTGHRVLGLPPVLKEVNDVFRGKVSADTASGGEWKGVSESDIGCVAADLCVSDFLLSDDSPAISAQRVVAFAKTLNRARFDELAIACRASTTAAAAAS